jgi:DNA polymerase, archaea type
LIGTQKIHLDKDFGDLNYSELAAYCMRDSEITYKLTSHDNDSAMKLMLVLTRISSMPMEDVSRQGVSRWIRNFMHREHRKKHLLIPNAEDILTKKGKTSTTAVIKGKKYKGAIVVEPTPGVHFNVAVMDFPSLYPSASLKSGIWVTNLSAATTPAAEDTPSPTRSTGFALKNAPSKAS